MVAQNTQLCNLPTAYPHTEVTLSQISLFFLALRSQTHVTLILLRYVSMQQPIKPDTVLPLDKTDYLQVSHRTTPVLFAVMFDD